ncbi:MAG: F420-0:Gamma-glutamyl ligase [Clostridia bacterium]|nr:F420-0:Gamma-glutamyl ligase [Clostridia bacterium]
MPLVPVPLRTHVVTARDDIADVARRYCHRIAAPGDALAISETVVAITQGRAILPETVRPRMLARFLCRFPDKDGSLATPAAMELAFQEVGTMRILKGAMAAAWGRLTGKRGRFFEVAGQELALFDDIAGTMAPFDRHIVMGPKNPDQVARQVKEVVGIDVCITDVNDRGCVDVLGLATDLEDPQAIDALKHEIEAALKTNPGGNDDEQTPLVLLKRIG